MKRLAANIPTVAPPITSGEFGASSPTHVSYSVVIDTGIPGETYDVDIRVRGHGERQTLHLSGGDFSQAPWYIGGTYNGYLGYDVYKVIVDDPPQLYFLNYGAQHLQREYDYTRTIQVKLGSTVTLDLDAGNVETYGSSVGYNSTSNGGAFITLEDDMSPMDLSAFGITQPTGACLWVLDLQDPSSAPILTDADPADAETEVALDAIISFRLQALPGDIEVGLEIDLATLEIEIDLGEGPVTAYTMGGETGGFTVVLDDSDPADVLVTITPPANFDVGTEIIVHVEVADTAAAELDESYSFFTIELAPLQELTLTATSVAKAGGTKLTFPNSGVADGSYLGFIGPDGDETGTAAYGPVRGKGLVIDCVGGVLSIVVPPLPIGGPYNLYLRNVGGSADRASALTNEFLTVVPNQQRSRVYSLRRLMHERMRVGPRTPEEET